MTPEEIHNEKDEQTSIEFSIVIPCLNEAETLGFCIQKANQWTMQSKKVCEIVIADNGSTDGSQEIAHRMGVVMIEVKERGYGSALIAGIEKARGKFIIMGDADNSYDFSALDPFALYLEEGYDLVMGNRFKGRIKRGAMPPLHRYLGNPVLSGIGKLFFHAPCSDFHCGLRAFRKASITKLDLRTRGMEFASEMVVKAVLHGLSIAEVPITLFPSQRSRPSHLNPWKDGWRHLRFLLLYSPRWLFFYPGLILMLFGLAVSLWLILGERRVGGMVFDVHTLLYAAMAVVIGFQAVIFALFTKVFAMSEGLLPENKWINRIFQHATLEIGIVVGITLFVIGLIGSFYATASWGARAFGPLFPSQVMRIVIPSVTSLVLGCQTILSSFFLSVLRLKRH